MTSTEMTFSTPAEEITFLKTQIQLLTETFIMDGGMTFDEFGVVLAVFAIWAVSKIPAAAVLKDRLRNKWTPISILIFFGAIATHQAAAMFYWAMGVLYLLSLNGSWTELKRKTIDYFGVGFGALGLYGCALQAVKKYGIQYVEEGYNAFETRKDYFRQLDWFFREPVRDALNFWNIFPSEFAAIVMKLLLVSAVIIALIRLWGNRPANPGNAPRMFFWAGIFAASVLLSYLPNLVMTGQVAFYRCSAGLTTLFLFAVFWAAQQWVALLSEKYKIRLCMLIAAAILLMGVVQTNQNINRYRVQLSREEYLFVKNKLHAADLTAYGQQIHFIRPDIDGSIHRWDEFGMMTTTWQHNLPGLVSGILIEINDPQYRIKQILADLNTGTFQYLFTGSQTGLKAYTLQITSSPENAPLPPLNKNAIIIDPTIFFRQTGKFSYLAR
ncbi:MAG: hypothetical protein HQL23_07360 [Candidatus Omnitrophica bacterium]|nr:hypothetical protein [Candidatus Omnitrophota bacterium]